MAQEASGELQVWRDEAMKTPLVSGGQEGSPEAAELLRGLEGNLARESRREEAELGWVRGWYHLEKRGRGRAPRALYGGLETVDFIREAIGSH